MKVWILKGAEPLPCDENPRLMRAGLLAQYLAERGHQVTWFATTYMHGEKKYRCHGQREYEASKNEKLVLLHSSTGYKKNISVARIVYHVKLARQFAKNSANYERPDVVFCCYPNMVSASEAIRYGRKNNVPVIIDVRDLWPDAFGRIFPQKLSWLADVLLSPLQLLARDIFRRADAITSVNPPGLRWALRKAGRKQGRFDRVVYIGYRLDEWKSEEERRSAVGAWEKYGITDKTWNIVFFSNLGKYDLDLPTPIKAVIRLSEKYPDIRLVVGGRGDGLESYRQEADGNPNIVFPGFLGNAEIHSLLELGKIGLFPRRNSLSDSKDAFGNKLIAYMSAGLAVLSCTQGFSRKYLERYDAGLIYEENDVESCCEMIERFYLDDGMRVRKGNNGYKRFCTDFDSEIVNRKFEELMEELQAHSAGDGERA